MDLKVANITEEGRYGGPQARITNIADKLKEKRIETTVIFPRDKSEVFKEKLDQKLVRSIPLKLHHLARDIGTLVRYFLFFIPELIYLVTIIKKEKFDIIHCNGSWQIKGAIAGKIAGTKVIWHLNDTEMPFLIRIIPKVLSLHFCHGFITAGKKVTSYYLNDRSLYKKRIVEIQAPVDTSVFDPSMVKENQRIKQFRGTKIVTAGNINPIKGIEYFIEMASILNEKYSDLYFFVLGPHLESQKSYSQKIYRMRRKLVLDNLHFCGFFDHVASVLKAADIYVCSSIAEASPISVWEAMSMGKAIVSTDVGDISNFITNTKNGFIVPIRDARKLAAKVGILIENKSLRIKLGEEARRVAVKELDIKVCVEKHRRFYAEVLAQERTLVRNRSRVY